MRSVSPLSPRRSLTVMMASASIPWTAAMVYIMAASISTPMWPTRFQRANVVRVGVVEDTARHHGSDVDRGARVAAHPRRGLGELERGGRGVRRHLGDAQRGLVVGGGADRDHRVAHPHPGLEAAARAHPDEAPGAEHHELLEHDARRRAAHARRLHADRFALEGAGDSRACPAPRSRCGTRGRRTSRRCTLARRGSPGHSTFGA